MTVGEKPQRNIERAGPHHSADGATNGVGLELTIEATGHLVNLQRTEFGIKIFSV